MRKTITVGGGVLLAFAILAGATARAETLAPRSEGSSPVRANADAAQRPAAPVLLSVEIVPEQPAAARAQHDTKVAAPDAARATIGGASAVR